MFAILKDGKVIPTDLLEWGRLVRESERQVALTTIGEVRVSTVFLGINHAVGADEPEWFETMVFGGTFDKAQQRYSTLHAARLGHEAMVAWVKGGE